jgi:hypothetical protein
VSGVNRPGAALTVVKLGGSFALSPHLRTILDAIVAAQRPVVIVPGGGPFADAVREAQPRMGFDDGAAHRMALMAMAQFAEALSSHSPRIKSVPGVAAIHLAIEAGAVPVWAPWPLASGVEALPESWNLTSDSLAAWLAGKLGASRLLLLKHRDPPSRPTTLRQAAKTGIVDPLFPDYAGHSGARVCWLGPSQLSALTDILDGRQAAGMPLADETRERLPA